jgi:hypothetical protein
VRAFWTILRLAVGYRALKQRSNREVLVLTCYSPSHKGTHELREALNEIGLGDTPLIVLRESTTLRSIPEADLRRLGWTRSHPSIHADQRR